MSVDVKVNDAFFEVPSGSVNFVVRNLVEGRGSMKDVREYLAAQKLGDSPRDRLDDFGYVDFDTEKPKIIGHLYTRTRFGMRLARQWPVKNSEN